MKFTDDLGAWLAWVIKIRFVIITFVFAIESVIQTVIQTLMPNTPNSPTTVNIKYLGLVVIFWYILSLFYLIYNQLRADLQLQAYLQLYCDLVIITAIVHVTGDLESHYFSLYLVAIILGSILLPRASAFLVAAVSFVLMGALLELAYLPAIYPEFAARFAPLRFLATTSPQVDLRTLQVKIFVSLFGFFAVAYLSSRLAESLRKTGAELRDHRGQLASLQAIHENIIQSMRDGLITADLDGKIRDLNPSGAAILGRNDWELKDQPIEAVLRDFPPDETAGPARREVTYLHPSGQHRILGVSVSPLVVAGTGAVGHVYSFQDLTEEKRREAAYRARDRLASLGRLSAGIAHEIRNPLASIAGSVKLLKDLADLNEDQDKLVDIVSRESERLNKLVSDFLLYARGHKFEFQEVDLVNLLEETLVLVQHHPLFGLACRIERKFPRHAVVASVDPDKVRQIVWNICDNSLKAMPQGGTLTAEIRDGDAQTVGVMIADTGVGFSEAQLEKLFEPFQSDFTKGTGLGLAIVYQIVEGHGGRIHVDSDPGKGSRFTIELPRSPRVDVAESATAASG